MAVEVDAGCNQVAAGCSFLLRVVGDVALRSMDLDIVPVLGAVVVVLRSLLG